MDFVCTRNSVKYYIQSARQEPGTLAFSQQLKALDAIGNHFKKIIITPDTPLTHYNDRGILILRLDDFLLKPDSLRF
ncbi:MAG: hypothetical protein SPL30_05335 [Succinivibrio sp.]|nr:hypothetical protein [Succinivibrio sp.]